MIGCVPRASALVEIAQVPVERLQEPIPVVPSEKAIRPVALDGLTDTVKVTGLPRISGFALELTVVVVAISWTTWLRVDEVLAT